jgi:hypothetical protein
MTLGDPTISMLRLGIPLEGASEDHGFSDLLVGGVLGQRLVVVSRDVVTDARRRAGAVILCLQPRPRGGVWVAAARGAKRRRIRSGRAAADRRRRQRGGGSAAAERRRIRR